MPNTSLPLNPVRGSPNLGVGEVLYDNFGYNVNELAAIIFCCLFGLATIAHLIQAIRSKHWYLLWTLVLGAAIETLGWACRAWAADSTFWVEEEGGFWTSSGDAFLAQITTLIFAPAFITAALYVILSRVIVKLGPGFCRFSARDYTWIFVTGDVLSLLVQVAGGVIAASADDRKGADSGAGIMVIGVIIQMVVMFCFSLILVEFTIRYITDRPVVRQFHPFAWTKNARAAAAARSSAAVERAPMVGVAEEKKAKRMLGALGAATVLIFVRSMYRTVELTDGWAGPIATNQTLFDVLDGGMIVLAVLLLNVFHPLYLLRERPQQTVYASFLELQNVDNDTDK